MKLLTRDEKNAKLREAGLSPTDIFSNGHRLWRTQAGDQIWVPDEDDEYPEAIVDKILRAAGRLRYRDEL